MDSPMGGNGEFFYQGDSDGEYSYASHGNHGGAYNVEESSLHSPAAINFNGWDWRIFQSLVQAKVNTFLVGGRNEEEEFEFENDLPDACDVEHNGTTWRDYSNGANGMHGNHQQNLYGKQHPTSSSMYNHRARDTTNPMGTRNGHEYMGGRSESFDSINEDEIDPYNTLSGSLTPSFDPVICDHPVVTVSSSGHNGSLGGGGVSNGGIINASNIGMKHLVDGTSMGNASGGEGTGGASTWNRSNGGRGTKRAGDTTSIITPNPTTSSSAGGGSHTATSVSTSRARGERRRMVADCKALRAQITSFEADWTKTHGTVHSHTITSNSYPFLPSYSHTITSMSSSFSFSPSLSKNIPILPLIDIVQHLILTHSCPHINPPFPRLNLCLK